MFDSTSNKLYECKYEYFFGFIFRLATFYEHQAKCKYHNLVYRNLIPMLSSYSSSFICNADAGWISEFSFIAAAS